MFAALDKGQVDALGITYLGSSSKYRIVAEFNPMPLYFGINKSRPDLKKSLDQALESLYFDNPGFQTSMHDKYFSMNVAQLPVFSKAEQEFLRKKTPVRVALQIDNAPFCFVDDKGKPVGVIPDLYAKLAQISGLNFTYLTAPTMMDAVALVENGKADVVAKFNMDASTAMKHHLRMSRPYMDVGLTQVTLKQHQPHPDRGCTHSPATLCGPDRHGRSWQTGRGRAHAQQQSGFCRLKGRQGGRRCT
jgi:ABC-type amino acid transport substrate-binding protein